MKFCIKAINSLLLITLLFATFACKEEVEDVVEVKIPLPEDNTISFIESTSIDGLDTLSIYQKIVEINLKYPLDSLVEIDNSGNQYKINLISAELFESSNIRFSSIDLSGKLLVFGINKLNPLTNYKIEVRFSVENENEESKSYVETINFVTYELPSHYAESPITAFLGEGNELGYFDLPMYEFLLTPGEILESLSFSFKSYLEVTLKKEAIEVPVNSITNINKIYLFDPANYLFTPGQYEVTIKQVFEEKIMGNWIKTDSFSSTNSFKILEQEIEFIQSKTPDNQSTIYRNQSFVYELANKTQPTQNFFDKIEYSIQSPTISNATGHSYSFDIYNDKNFYRIKPIENFDVGETIILNGNIRFILVNDSINFSHPATLTQFSNQFEVSSEFSTLITGTDFSTAYPYPRQRFFLIGEYNKGGFQFVNTIGIEQYVNSADDYEVIFINELDTLSTTANWNQEDLSLRFDLPAGLKTNSLYQYQLYSDKSGLIFSDYFTTSYYHTFSEKTAPENFENIYKGAMVLEESGELPAGFVLSTGFEPVLEPMDRYEYTNIFNFVGHLDETQWFMEHIYPIIYENYDELPFKIQWRDTTKYGGTIPSKAHYVVGNMPLLTDQEIISNELFDFQGRTWALKCLYGRVMAEDFKDLKQQALSFSGDNEYVDIIKNATYTLFTKDVPYPVSIQYKIPIYNVVSSTFETSYYRL